MIKNNARMTKEVEIADISWDRRFNLFMCKREFIKIYNKCTHTRCLDYRKLRGNDSREHRSIRIVGIQYETIEGTHALNVANANAI